MFHEFLLVSRNTGALIKSDEETIRGLLYSGDIEHDRTYMPEKGKMVHNFKFKEL